MSEIQSESDRLSTDDVEDAMATSTLQLLRGLLNAAQQSGPAVARRAGLTPTELSSLEQLTQHQWGPGDLARHLGVTSAAASGIVDRLVARGHVERRPDEHDGRRTRVVLTDSGRSEVLGHLMPMFAELDALDRSLTDDERAVVDRFLAAATAAIRRVH